MTHSDEVAVDPQEAGALHFSERVLANTERPAGATQLSVVERVVRGRQQHHRLRVLGQASAPIEECPFHPSRERQIRRQQVGPGQLAPAELRRSLNDGQGVASGARRQHLHHLVRDAGARALLEQ